MTAQIFARFLVLSGKMALRFSSFVPPFRTRLPGGRQGHVIMPDRFLESWGGASAGGIHDNLLFGMFRTHDRRLSYAGRRTVVTLWPLGKGMSGGKMPIAYPMRSVQNSLINIVTARARADHKDAVFLQPDRRSVSLPISQAKISHLGSHEAGYALQNVGEGGSRSVRSSDTTGAKRKLGDLLAGRVAYMPAIRKKARGSCFVTVPVHDASPDRRAIGNGSVRLEGPDYPGTGHHTGRYDPAVGKALHRRPVPSFLKGNKKLLYAGVLMSHGFTAVPPHAQPVSGRPEKDAGTLEAQGRPQNSISGDVEGYFPSGGALFSSVSRSRHVSMRAQGAMIDEIALPQYPNLSVGCM